MYFNITINFSCKIEGRAFAFCIRYGNQDQETFALRGDSVIAEFSLGHLHWRPWGPKTSTYSQTPR